MSIKSVRIRGYNGHGFGSSFIRRFTFGNYSHVSIVFDTNHGEEEYESIQGRGVIVHAPYTREEKDFVELLVPINEEQRILAHITAMEMLGSSYDWLGIWGFMVRKDRHSKDRWFCSEYVAYCLLKAGYALSRREPYRETPDSVMMSYRLIDPEVHNA